MGKFTVIYTTFPEKNKALEICKKLLEDRLIVCFNMFEIKSGYWWENSIEISSEYAVFLKTMEEKVEKLKGKLFNLHPYDVPAFIEIKTGYVAEEYLKWAEKEISRNV